MHLMGLALLSFLISNLAHGSVESFLNRVLLVQEIGKNGEIKNQYFDSFQKDPSTSMFRSTSPNISSFSAFGMCLNLEGTPCSTDLISKAEFTRALAVSSGRREVDTSIMPSLQDFPISSTTTINSAESEALIVRVDQKLFGGLGSSFSNFKLQKVEKLSSAVHSFKVPDSDAADRRPISEVDNQLRDLALSVVQLVGANGDSLLGNTASSGTGFFISSDGLLMTNHHVIYDFKVCLQDLLCRIDFEQVIPDGTRRKFNASATLLTISEQHDFALLKVDLPKDLKFAYITLENTNIGSSLLTLGYPGDMREGDHTRLTYSFGSLVGFSSRVYSTSAYIYHGASGSPLLDAKSLNAVAILSNGAGNPIPGTGAPGLARPLLVIDSEFGLSDYISGSKLSRVNSILKQVQASVSAQQAELALDAYQKERTFLGLRTLKQIMVTHSTPEVRIAILEALEEAKVILGVSGN